MLEDSETSERSTSTAPMAQRRRTAPAARPGVLIVFSSCSPLLIPVPLPSEPDGSLELGRNLIARFGHGDISMSRCHARLSYDGRRFVLTDLGSRHGCHVDGVPVRDAQVATDMRVIRAGDTLFLPVADVGAVGSGEPEGVAADEIDFLEERLQPPAGLRKDLPALRV